MFQAVKNVFNSQDLPGEFLLTPLKAYHQFFAEKIQANSGLYKAAWIIANVVSGIFAYPIFGILALLGMLIKPTGIPSLRKHNQDQISSVEAERIGMRNSSEGFLSILSSSISQRGYEMRVHREFRATKASFEVQCDEAVAEIRRCSEQFKQIYVEAAALIDGDGNGGVIVRLRTFSPIDPSAVGHSRSRGQRVRVEEPDDSRALASPGASRRPDSRSSVKIEEVD